MKNKRDDEASEATEDYTLNDFDLSQPQVIREAKEVKPKYVGKLRTTKTSISLPEYIVDDLRHLARIKGMASYQSVIREILSEKVYEEKRRLNLF
jgi:hypothetical protein